ncbi:MAG: helix-turn-helix domain-containing protein [Candidatus Cryptobacteroides sp.]
MDQLLYRCSLLMALPLMLFFGLHMLLARVPEKKQFANFLLSRRLMGIALLVLAANYTVHFLFEIRLRDVNTAILFNMATYFLCYWLFSCALMALLEKSYVTRKLFAIHLVLWMAYSLLSAAVAFLVPGAVPKAWATIVLAVLLVIYGLFLSARLLRTYSRSIRMFENTHSDDIGAYISWLSVFTYWAVAYGVSCGLLTFLPDRYIFIWVLSAIPFYIYLYCSYQNYIFFHENVENAFVEDEWLAEDGSAAGKEIPGGEENTPAFHQDIEKRIGEWIEGEGYLKPGITLNDLSAQLCTNRTYLSSYINTVYQKSFRDWISDLRIEYAKRLMTLQPLMKVQDVSESSGFLSLSHFTRMFTAKEGCSPAKWRRSHMG